MRDAIPPSRIALAVGDLRFKATGPRTGVYAEKPWSRTPPRNSPIPRACSRPPRSCSVPIASSAATSWCCRRSFRSPRWAIRARPSSRPPSITGDRSEESVVARARGAGLGRGPRERRHAARCLDRRGARGLHAEPPGSRRCTARRARPMERRARGARRARGSRADGSRRIRCSPSISAIATRSVSRAAADEKGGLLFTFLDGKFGRERFDAFLQGYFDHFAFKSITTEEFLGYLKENLLDRFPGIVSASQVAAWVEEPGLPPEAPLLAVQPYESVDRRREARGSPARPPPRSSTRAPGSRRNGLTFSTDMPGPLRKDQLRRARSGFGFTRSRERRDCRELAHAGDQQQLPAELRRGSRSSWRPTAAASCSCRCMPSS